MRVESNTRMSHPSVLPVQEALLLAAIEAGRYQDHGELLPWVTDW